MGSTTGVQQAHEFTGDGLERLAITLGATQNERAFHAGDRRDGDRPGSTRGELELHQPRGELVNPGSKGAAHNPDQIVVEGADVNRDASHGTTSRTTRGEHGLAPKVDEAGQQISGRSCATAAKMAEHLVRGPADRILGELPLTIRKVVIDRAPWRAAKGEHL